MTTLYRVGDWFSFSHWGMFALPILRGVPDWALGGMDIDDELVTQDKRGTT